MPENGLKVFDSLIEVGGMSSREVDLGLLVTSVISWKLQISRENRGSLFLGN